MLSLVKTDINILMHKKGFQFTFLLILLYAMWTTVYYVMQQKGMDASEMYHPVKVSGLNSVNDYVWFFCKWFPFFIVLPAGFCIMNDKNARVRTLIKSRVGNCRYYVSKLISSFVVTFIVVFIPFFIQCLVNHVVFPVESAKDLTNWETYSEVYYTYTGNYLFSGVYYSNIYIYFVMALTLSGVFAGCLAVFLVGISTFEFKYKAFLFLPVYLVFYVIEQMVDEADKLGWCDIYLNDYISIFDITDNKSELYYILLMLVLAVTGIILTIINARRKSRVD